MSFATTRFSYQTANSPPHAQASTEYSQSDLLAPETELEEKKEPSNTSTVKAPLILPGLGIHPDFGDLIEREAKYRKINETDLGHTGFLLPKYIIDLVNYEEGTICGHDSFWTKTDVRGSKNPTLCLKCKYWQKYTIRQCFLCKTKCCNKCYLEVMEDIGNVDTTGASMERGSWAMRNSN
ncbi:hypothetical protein AA313_de0207948 [Arthrobotrys entomopaga]|nr:hypothetical protein AA313_de0207948 [Arthrobotrys entomopaga]